MSAVLREPEPPGVWAALGRGLGMVRGATRGLLLAYALNLGLTALLGAVVFDALSTSLGSSQAGARMREGWDARWHEGFAAQAQGVAATFRPSLSGAGGVLDALDAFADGFTSLFARGTGNGILLAMAAYLLAWAFLGAAFLGTFTRTPAAGGFLHRGAHWLPRLLPLTLAGLVAYAVLLGPVRQALEAAVGERLRDVIDERVHVAAVVAAHLALWLVVALASLVLDYAKVFLVLRDEGDALARPFRALGAGASFVARRPLATGGLYALTALLGLAALALYVVLAPGPAGGSWAGIALAFLLGQVFVLSRIALRALFLAGEVALAAPAVLARERGRQEPAPVPAAPAVSASAPSPPPPSPV